MSSRLRIVWVAVWVVCMRLGSVLRRVVSFGEENREERRDELDQGMDLACF